MCFRLPDLSVQIPRRAIGWPNLLCVTTVRGVGPPLPLTLLAELINESTFSLLVQKLKLRTCEFVCTHYIPGSSCCSEHIEVTMR